MLPELTPAEYKFSSKVGVSPVRELTTVTNSPRLDADESITALFGGEESTCIIASVVDA